MAQKICVFKYIFSNYGKEKMHLASQVGINFERKSYRYDAFHFDGHKVGNFLKNECKDHNIKIYDSVVKNVNLDDDIKKHYHKKPYKVYKELHKNEILGILLKKQISIMLDCLI